MWHELATGTPCPIMVWLSMESLQGQGVFADCNVFDIGYPRRYIN